VAREVLDHLAFKAQRLDVTLHLQAPAVDVRIEADAGALFVLLKNLVDNALDFAPSESEVRVLLDEAGLTVSDHGPGVLPEHRARVFERFWRAPGQSRPGSGLGLAVVSEIALVHGWTVGYSEAPGGGALFAVRWRP
jgi:signal transduction histidine kinase